jgi:hypothetical protein
LGLHAFGWEFRHLVEVRKRATYDFSNRVAFNAFSGDGKRLLVLTSDQVVYMLDPATNATTASASK